MPAAKMNPVVHFEMPYVDAKRLDTFYSSVFGWDMKAMDDPAYGGYVTADTTESTPKGPVNPGAINGGFFPKSDDPGRNVPSFVISVDNLTEAMEKVAAAGGTIHGEPQTIPGVGLWVVFTDTEGNRLSMLQASREG